MNRFLFLLAGLFLFCLAFGMIQKNYSSSAATVDFNSDLVHSQEKVEVQAQQIDLKKNDNGSHRQ
jgi:hypothetical protein